MVEHDLAKVGVAGSTPVSRSILDRLSSSFFKYIKVFIFLNPLRNAVWRFASQTSPSACGSEKAKLLLIVFLCANLSADDTRLKSSYIVKSNIVTLKTLNLSDSNKTVMELKKGRSSWSVPTFKILAKLKELGYECKPPNSSMILFNLYRKKRFPKLEKVIKNRYEKLYPTLAVDSITIESTGVNTQNFVLKPECEVRLSRKLLRKNRGTFTVRCGKKRYYFRYRLSGYITLYKANHQIKKDKIIDPSSVNEERVEFGNYYASPVIGKIFGRYIARQNIASGKVLTRLNVEPMPAVLKNSRVKCFYKEGAVTIELDAIALQNGNIGDTITVKKSDGKVLRGEIVQRGSVELK